MVIFYAVVFINQRLSSTLFHIMAPYLAAELFTFVGDHTVQRCADTLLISACVSVLLLLLYSASVHQCCYSKMLLSNRTASASVLLVTKRLFTNASTLLCCY